MLFERWADLIGRFNHKAGCSDSFGILHDIDWPKTDSRCTFVLRLFLDNLSYQQAYTDLEIVTSSSIVGTLYIPLVRVHETRPRITSFM